MTLAIDRLPTPAQRATCRSCGAEIAWVHLNEPALWRPIDVEPRHLGEYALLPDGVRAVNLREPRLLASGRDEGIPDEVRYFDHVKTCIAPSLRTCAAALSRWLNWQEAVYDDDPERASRFAGDADREARRYRLLEEDRHRRAADFHGREDRD